MTRINALRNLQGPGDVFAWASNIWGNINALVFAAVLIVCSVTVGCSSEKPKPVSSNNQIPVTAAPSPAARPAPPMQAENKPAPKRVVHRKPATVNYTDKTYGVTFEYPRRYAIETGDAAAELLTSSPVPMNFVEPGGIALATVELPETYYPNTDFSSAYFNVSVHKTLTADQCSEFAIPQPKMVEPVASTEAPSPNAALTPTTPTQAASSTEAQPASTQSAPASGTSPTATSTDSKPASSSASDGKGSKLMLGDLELRATEAVSGEGTRQSDAKYFHVFQNGACYEFALNLTTIASQDGLMKHVDRDKVFSRLEKILDTVKINPVAPEVTAEAPATPAPAQTPAQ